MLSYLLALEWHLIGRKLIFYQQLIFFLRQNRENSVPILNCHDDKIGAWFFFHFYIMG